MTIITKPCANFCKYKYSLMFYLLAILFMALTHLEFQKIYLVWFNPNELRNDRLNQLQSLTFFERNHGNLFYEIYFVIYKCFYLKMFKCLSYNIISSGKKNKNNKNTRNEKLKNYYTQKSQNVTQVKRGTQHCVYLISFS